MDFESNIKDIKRLIQVLTGKDTDVSITYKGTSYGVTQPWNIRCDSREINDESHEGAASKLLDILRKELRDKISFTEKQAAEYKKALGNTYEVS